MQHELALKCGELCLPKSHRTKAQMFSTLIAYSEAEDLSQLQLLSNQCQTHFSHCCIAMQRELAVKCGELGLPKSHRTKAQMVSNLIAYSEGEDLSQLQPLLGKEMMEGPRQARVAPYDLTGRPEVFEQPMNNAQTKSSGPRNIYLIHI